MSLSRQPRERMLNVRNRQFTLMCDLYLSITKCRKVTHNKIPLMTPGTHYSRFIFEHEFQSSHFSTLLDDFLFSATSGMPFL